MADPQTVLPAGRARQAPAGGRRMLIVNPFGIGDVLFTTTLVRVLRQAFPDSYLGYLCNRRTVPVLRHNPHLDELFVYEKDELAALSRQRWGRGVGVLLKLLRQVRRRRFGWVIDLSLGERYSFLLRLLGVRWLGGFDFRRRGRFLNERMPIDGYRDVHVVEYYRRLLSFLGFVPHPVPLEMVVSPQDQAWARAWMQAHMAPGEGPVVGLVPAGGVSWGIAASFRRWSSAGFAAVAGALQQQHRVRLVLFGEASDAPTCRQVSEQLPGPVSDLSGKTTLGQFVALLGRMDLVVCNDGGPLHLAVSQGVRTVSVFGPVDERVYGPYMPGPSRHRVVVAEGLGCRPCYTRFRLPPCPYERACLSAVAPAEVLEACTQALASS